MAPRDDWWLCRETGCLDQSRQAPGLRDEALVLLWLRGLGLDSLKMLQIRRTLAAEFGTTELYRMSDQMVLRQTARLLISGKFHFHGTGKPVDRPVIRSEGTNTQPSRPAPASVPRSSPRPAAVAPFREPPVDDPTFPGDTDFQAQAATLAAAAGSGKPFCLE